MNTENREAGSDPLMKIWISLGDDILKMSPEQLNAEVAEDYDGFKTDGQRCQEIGLRVLASWKPSENPAVMLVEGTHPATAKPSSTITRIMLDFLVASLTSMTKIMILDKGKLLLFLSTIPLQFRTITVKISFVAIICGSLYGAISFNNKIAERKTAEANVFIDKGVELFNKNDYYGAIDLYIKAINIDKNSFVAYNNLGYTFGVINNVDYALKNLTKSIKINQSYTRAWSNRGILYSNIGKYPEAISDLTVALSLAPNDASLLNDRGLAYFMEGQLDVNKREKDYELALKDYDDSIKAAPTFPWPYNNRGNIALLQGNLEQAIKEYTDAVNITPFAMPYKNRAIAYILSKRFDEAIEDFGKALKIVPTFADALNGRGVAEMDKGNLEAAISDFNEAIQLSPQQVGYYGNRSLAQALSRNMIAAESDLDKALELDPNNQSLIELKKKVHQHDVLSASFLCDQQIESLKSQDVACGGGKNLS